MLLLSRVLRSSIHPSLGVLQDANQIVGERIRKLRLAKGFTQDRFAEHSGLNRSHLYRVETGRQSPTVGTLKTIADALDLRVKDLVKDL